MEDLPPRPLILSEVSVEAGGQPLLSDTSVEMPASFGEQGPGEMTMCEGSSARTSSTDV